MRNYKLLLGSALLSGALLFSASIYLNKTSTYSLQTGEKENNKKDKKEGAGGAARWLFNIQKNPLTGLRDPNDVLLAREQAGQLMKNRSSNSALGLEWSELGPNNVGGRTRAILIDKNNPGKIFAGGVAGGLWVSTNSGSSWSVVPGFDQQPNLAITCITQASNGDIYVGTGEDLYYLLGTGSAGILGGGIYKSSNGGASFDTLQKTVPVANSISNTVNTRFIGVNNIAADPTNSNRIYAATRNGLQMTDNGGQTWHYCFGGAMKTARATDVDIAADGTIISAIDSVYQGNVFGKGFMSSTGDSASFTAISGGFPSGGISRIEFAIAPSDPNYMYAVLGNNLGLLKGVYQSVNKGQNWALIGNGGSSQFEPFGSSSQSGQAEYDMALAVYHNDKTKIILGGVTVWGWKQTNPGVPAIGQWNAISTQWDSPMNPTYVHSDVHTIKFDPVNTDRFYIGCDGGVFLGIETSQYGLVFQARNSGFNVTQFYSLAFEGDGKNGKGVMAGAQDNGTQYISGINNNYPYQNGTHINGGDGAECEVSFLNPNVSFTTVYYGSLARHSSKGGTGSGFYSKKIQGLTGMGDPGFASFVTPIALYETKTATNSPDSILFVNGSVSQIVGTSNGLSKHFSGNLSFPQRSATVVPGSIVITAGLQTITDNGSGKLIGSVDANFNSTSNNIDYPSGHFDFNFNTQPSNAIPVNLTFDVMYANGAVITITRADYVDSLNYTTTSILNPGDQVKIYDPFQAKLAVGFNGKVYLTKGCLNFSATPAWFQIGTITGTAEELSWSADGDILYVGTDNGYLYRFSNLAKVKDSLTGDIASGSVGGVPRCVVKKTQIAKFGVRFITGLSVDPIDPGKLVVTLGNYGNTAYVYYSTNADSCGVSALTTNFTNVQGNLPTMPVYTALIEKNDPKRVILGTEHGIWSTDDITAATPVWSSDNGVTGLFPNVPVFKIRQQRRPGTEVNNPYVIYAATHGRGLWKSEKYMGPVTIGINEQNSSIKNSTDAGLTIYPNPMNEKGTVAFNLASTADVVISIYNMQGKLVKTIKPGKLSAGEQKVEIKVDELSKGTYFVSIDGTNNIHATSKFVVVK